MALATYPYIFKLIKKSEMHFKVFENFLKLCSVYVLKSYYL